VTSVEEREPGVDRGLFREVMGGFATGVAVVTTEADGEIHGMTLNSLTSVSLQPTLILVCLTRESRTARAVARRGGFVVNLLGEHQETVSRRFSAPNEDHFEGLELRRDEDGMPVLADSIGHLACRIEAVHEGGDHLIVLGRVSRCEPSGGEPLLFYRGRYGRYARWETKTEAPAREAGFWFGW
jgi:flavin reductase (DIM6/NTAB) family NADH-FMN oxidoreductase RutF